MTDPTQRYTLALEIGEEAVRLGKWQQALTCFQAALTGLPREPRVYNGLGDTHVALADQSRALACYKEAARLGGKSPVYIEKVARIQEQLGMIPEAAQSRLITGDIYWSRNQPEEAEAQWDEAIRLQADMLAARERLILARKLRGDKEGVEAQYLALAEKLAQEGRHLMALHICYTATEEFPDSIAIQEAMDQAWRAVAVRDQRAGQPGSRVEVGDLLNAASDFAQWQLSAAIHQSTLSNGDKTNSEAHLHLRQAILNEGYGRAGSAISSYEKAIATGLESPAAFFVLGLLYRLVGHRDEAQAALTLAARHPFYRRAVDLLE